MMHASNFEDNIIECKETNGGPSGKNGHTNATPFRKNVEETWSSSVNLTNNKLEREEKID